MAGVIAGHFVCALVRFYDGLPENSEPITLNATPTRAMIITIAHEEATESLFVTRNPIAASIQPQIAKTSNVDNKVDSTGIVCPSTRKPRLAFKRLR